MKNYFECNNIEPVVQPCEFMKNCYSNPHHAVIQSESMFTKLRVVVNAPAEVGNR